LHCHSDQLNHTHMTGLLKNSRSVGRKYRLAMAGMLLIFLTVAVYWQIIGHDFIVIDDEVYVYENPHVQKGITPESLAWAFRIGDKEDTYWHPLTWISHMADGGLFGLRPGGHHFSSLLLHLANCLLLFSVLRQMTGSDGRSLLVAALFALHPLNVESVAWIAERKNLLSSFFWMLTLLAYIRYCRAPGLGTYLVTVLIFALGLLAKPMLVTLPAVLLLLDYWPLDRKRSGRTTRGAADSHPGQLQYSVQRLVMEKIPLLVLSGGSVCLSLLSLQKIGAIVPAGAVPFDLRLANALVSYAAYIWKMVWPTGLAVIYPYPETLMPAWQIIGATLLLTACSLFFIGCAKDRPYRMVGWLWYLGTLLPVSGLVQGGLWPAMADRWTYIPLIGLFIIMAWSLPDPLAARDARARWAAGLSIAVCLMLGAVTWKQAGYWQNSIALLEHTVRVTAPNAAAHEFLGVSLDRQGRTAEAIVNYRKALDLKPDFADVHNDLGNALYHQGKKEAAIAAYQQVLALRPGDEKAHFNLGIVMESQGRSAAAEAYYRNAIGLKPDFTAAHYKLGVILETLGRLDDAVVHYRTTIQLSPDFEDGYNRLAVALGKQGHTREAIEYYRRLLRLNPDNARGHFNLAVALSSQGPNSGALEHYARVLQLEPDFTEAHNNIAILHFNRGNVSQAKEHLLKAIQLDADNALARENLAIILKQSDQE